MSYIPNSAQVLVLLVAGLLVVGSPAEAQDVRWSVSLGGTASSFHGNASNFAQTGFVGQQLPSNFASYRTGVHVRGGFDVLLTRRFGIQAEAAYAQAGGILERERVGPADGPLDERITFKLDDLSFPVLATFRIPSLELGVRPELFAGPALNVRLRSTAAIEGRSFDSRLDYNRTSDVAGPTVHVAGIVGAAFAYPLASGREVALDVRYRYSQSRVGIQDAQAQPQMSTINVGLRFTFGL
ncbi:MAG: porin family protein [Longimonas sp.]|uniref:porin family protein n=1 Tax=Longimonas sp. TaxID=2039626 RepID=UPI00334F1AC4